MAIKLIRKTDEIFDELTSQLEKIESSIRFDYNALVTDYNTLLLQEKAQFAFERAKSSNLTGQLKTRGLVRDQDYSLVFAQVPEENAPEGAEGTWTAFITRISMVDGKVLESTRGRKPLTDEQKKAQADKRALAKAAAVVTATGVAAKTAPAKSAPAKVSTGKKK